MTPTQIANLECELLRLARLAKEDKCFYAAMAYQTAATLLIQAASKPTRRKFKRPLDLGKVAG